MKLIVFQFELNMITCLPNMLMCLLNFQPLVPSVFSISDIRGVILESSKSVTKLTTLHVYCDTIIVSDELHLKCYSLFDPIMTQKAHEVS